MQQQSFKSLLDGFIRHYNLHDSNTQISDQQMLTRLRTKNGELADKLAALLMAETMAEFLKKDHELRTKMPDIWQIQLDKSKTELESIRMELEKIAADEGIHTK